MRKAANYLRFAAQSVEKIKFKSFRPPFSKGGGYLGQSPKPTSAEVGTPQYKAMYYCLRNSTKFCRGVGHFFQEKKRPTSEKFSQHNPRKRCRWHVFRRTDAPLNTQRGVAFNIRHRSRCRNGRAPPACLRTESGQCPDADSSLQ